MIIENEKLQIHLDSEFGIVTALYCKKDKMNWVISPDVLKFYGYERDCGCLLGKSFIQMDSLCVDTGFMKPDSVECNELCVSFLYHTSSFMLKHTFKLVDDALVWYIELTNQQESTLELEKMYHWIPVSYVMHENTEDNFDCSCSLVPSISANHSRIICKKRSGNGVNLIITNKTGEMKSVGSLCRYKNLFFEKSAPSLSGLVLYNVVNAYKDSRVQEYSATDWQYKDMYRTISLEAYQKFSDCYTFNFYDHSNENAALLDLGCADVVFEPVVFIGEDVFFKITYASSLISCKITECNELGGIIETLLQNIDVSLDGVLRIPPFNNPGERKLELTFEDNTKTFIVFTVYKSMFDLVSAFCDNVFTHKFIDDPKSSVFCAYESTSRQGESCAKGSAILLKNYIFKCEVTQVQQVERNCVFYLRNRWLDDEFVAIKQYPGGFARILDMDYLIMAFYLLSFFDDSCLLLNNSDTYLLWAYKTAVYRFSKTPDKLPRECFESELASMISWWQIEMISKLKERGFLKEADNLCYLWNEHIKLQCEKVKNLSFVETEHYFDNAGISMCAETLLNSGKIDEGLQAAFLLLANVGMSNDYRNYAPDRWWEALSCMYHNLWAVFSAKAMLSAYEKSFDNRYLFAAYRGMMPMFYNYDSSAKSALNVFQEGDGVSAYCLTSPNLNNAFCSRNRFGQSVFKDEFFLEMDVSGDDWDLGADMVVYMQTFGQNAYVTQVSGQPVCVNGKLTQKDDELEIVSHAAFPSAYFIEEYNMWIKRKSTGMLIHSIVLKNSLCKIVKVSLTDKDIIPQVICTIKGKTIITTPEIQIIDLK